MFSEESSCLIVGVLCSDKNVDIFPPSTHWSKGKSAVSTLYEFPNHLSVQNADCFIIQREARNSFLAKTMW